MNKQIRLLIIGAAALAAMTLAGCGGSSDTTDVAVKSGNIITSPATMEQLQADLQVLGKTMPEFLASGAPDLQPNTRTLLEVLPFNRWTTTRSVPRARTQWYEVNLTNPNYPTDIAMDAISGDPDLYIFSPLRLYGDESLVWVGYDIGGGDANLGSFYPRDFGGAGRFLVAVHGYTAARFRIKPW